MRLWYSFAAWFSKYGNFVILVAFIVFFICFWTALSSEIRNSEARAIAVASAMMKENEKSMTTIKSTWKSGGVERELVTTKGATETADQHAARHLAEFNSAIAVFPIDE